MDKSTNQDSVNNYGDLLQQLAQMLKASRHAIVFTGAGISTPSGIPDFRSPNSGLWNHNDPFKVASIQAFHHNPQVFFNWIRPLSLQAESAQPNSAHLAVAELEKKGLIHSVITQNIDGLHQKAGSSNVLELHGSARTATCLNCGKKHQGEYFKNIILDQQGIAYCENCGKIIKPDVVLFGEELPDLVWNKAYQECLETDLILIAGSSLEVSPANSLPIMALHRGAKLVINNLGKTHLDSYAVILLQMDVLQGIGQLPFFL